MIQQAIKYMVEQRDLSREEAKATMSAIMNGETTPAQIGAFLIAARLKGETLHEVAGFAEAMREKAVHVKTGHEDAIDMCGTGGDGSGSINVSTIASFVVAAGGVAVAKHGNRSISSKCGSADVLEAMGVNIGLSTHQMSQCLDEVGIAFLFAPTLHPAMKHAIAPRREIGQRTVFNILGPLTNPAGVKRQVLGVFNPQFGRLMAEVLRELGAKHVMVVHGDDGLDEISVSGPTLVIELLDGNITEKKIHPEDFGIHRSDSHSIDGGEQKQNAKLAMGILQGESGAARDVVVANAACGLIVGGRASSLQEARMAAEEAIDSGAALQKLEKLIEFSNRV